MFVVLNVPNSYTAVLVCVILITIYCQTPNMHDIQNGSYCHNGSQQHI